MTLRILLFSVLSVTFTSALAQVKIGTGSSSPLPGAMLEIESNNRGLLLPRLNQAQLNSVAVSASSAGLTVYNTDSNQLYLYNGQRWRPLTYSDTTLFWSLRGNQQLQTGTRFLGSTDTTDLQFRTNNMLRQTIKATGRIGFGTDAPSSGFQVTLRSTSQQTDDLRLENYFSQPSTGTPSLVILNSRGTPESPQNLQVGDVLGGLTWEGRIDNANTPMAGMISYLVSGGSNPSSDLLIYNSGKPSLYIGPTGAIGMGTQAPGAGLDVWNDPLFFGKAGIRSTVYNSSNLEFPTMTMFRARGTQNSPQNAAANDRIGELRFDAQISGAPVTTASIAADYIGNGTMPDLRTNLQFYTGVSTTPQMTLNNQGFLGIGAGLPIGALDILNDNRGDAYDDIRLSSYGPNSGPALLVLKSRGTASNPQNVQNGDFLGILQFAGWVNNTYTGLGQIISNYTGNGTTERSSMQFRTAPNAGMLLDYRGWLTAGNPSSLPTATLDVRGSMAWRINSADAVTTYLVSDNEVVVNLAPTSTVTSVILPSDVGFQGRLVVLRNSKASAVTLISAGTLLCKAGVTCGTIPSNETYGFIGNWNGTTMQWIQLF
jgi:hypothetical protein